MIYQVIQYLTQGDLPSAQKLDDLKKQKITHLLNISGIDLRRLYSAEQLDPFTLVQFTFRDVFSTGVRSGSTQTTHISSALYCDQTNLAERLAFFQAAQQLVDWLKQRVPCYVFCQQGQGRSPCVVCAALTYCYQPKPDELLKTLKFLNPNAIITNSSYAAINWFVEQMQATDE